MDKSEILRRISIIKEGILDAKTLPKVYLLHGSFSDSEMNELYNHPKVKAMVSLTKGEGFGRPLLEFSSVDKPIIATNWSGHTDFLQGKYNIMVGGELSRVHKSAAVPNMILEESEWFRPKLEDIGYALNNVWEEYELVINNAKLQGSYSRKYYSFKKMKNQIKSIFKDNLKVLPKKMELNIGNIKMPKKPKPTLKKV